MASQNGVVASIGLSHGRRSRERRAPGPASVLLPALDRVREKGTGAIPDPNSDRSLVLRFYVLHTHRCTLDGRHSARPLSIPYLSIPAPDAPQTRGLAGGEVHVRRFVLPPRPLAALARVPRPLGRHALPIGIALPLVGAAAGGLQSVGTQHARTIRRRLNWRGTRTTHGSGCPPPSASSGPLLDNTSQRAARASHTPHRPHTHDIHE